MMEITLTQGKIALIDDDDFDIINEYNWYAAISQSKQWTARAKVTRNKTIFMHRLILGAPVGTLVDHVNGDTLDNRRENLRFATHNQNSQNRKKMNNTTSRFKGVTFSFREKKWVVRLHCNGKKYYLGAYHDEEIAARVYDDAAREHFGEFARTNF